MLARVGILCKTGKLTRRLCPMEETDDVLIRGVPASFRSSMVAAVCSTGPKVQGAIVTEAG